MLEMDILTEKTDNNKPIFDSLREQINEAKESMDTSSDKAKDIIKNIKTNIAKVLYGAQFQDILKQLDESTFNHK